MKLVEIIEQEGLEGISLKTNISEPNLKALLDEDLTKLTRVKALGFLVILEREYPEIEVEELRDRVKDHYKKSVDIPENVIVLSRERPGEGGGFSLFKWFIILALLAGGWYLYNEGKLDGLLSNIKDKEESFDDNKALESNSSRADAKKVIVEKSKERSVTIDTVDSIEAPKVEKSIVLTSDKSNERNRTVPVGNIQSVMSEVVTTKERNKTVDPLFELQKEAPLAEDNTTAKAITTITINPTRGRLWFGFINVDTKERKEFMNNVSTPFDIKGGRFLLVTGHGYVDLISELKTVEVADRKKHYFYIDSTEIRELTKKEFRDMNGRRGW